jgi:hypothetical protein
VPQPEQVRRRVSGVVLSSRLVIDRIAS